MEKSEKSLKCCIVNWDKAYRLSIILARKIKKSGYKPDLIIGIARGGLVPARIVCDFLHQRDITTINVEHWGIATMHEEAKIKFPLSVDISKKTILIIDDVADTGDTFSKIIDYVKGMNPAEIKTAALQYKTCSKFIPDYWVEKQDKWNWIMYPWAVYEDMTEFIERVLIYPMTYKEIKKCLKSSFDIRISEVNLLEILNDIEMLGKIRKRKEGRKILWEKH